MVEHHSVWGNPGFLFKFGQLGLASGYLGTHARLFYSGRAVGASFYDAMRNRPDPLHCLWPHQLKFQLITSSQNTTLCR